MRRLRGGEDWDARVLIELEQADIILFLITSACLTAHYMWDDEFAVALTRFREGQGRVRIIPVLYADTPAPVRTNRYTRGLNYIPRQTHEHDPDNWFLQVAQGVALSVAGVISQSEPPALRLGPAITQATARLEAAKDRFSIAPSDGLYGPVLASEVHSILGALELALGLPGRERTRVLSIYEPRLRNCFVRLRPVLPEHFEILRALRDALDEVSTFSNDEDLYGPSSHTPSLVPISAETDALAETVRSEISAAREVLSDLSDAPSAPTRLENEIRDYTADVGDRHAALAEVILDDLQIDSTALSEEVAGVGTVAGQFAEALRELGDEATPLGLKLSDRLTERAARAGRFSDQLARTSRPVEPAPVADEATTPEANIQKSTPPRPTNVFVLADPDDWRFDFSAALERMGETVRKASANMNISDISRRDVIILAQSMGNKVFRNKVLRKTLVDAKLKGARFLRVHQENQDQLSMPRELEYIVRTQVPNNSLEDFNEGIENVFRFIHHEGEYHAFTDQYDEIVSASTLLPEKEKKRLLSYIYKEFNEQLPFILPEEILKNFANTFSAMASDLAVTLLIDNSGSMRGRPILTTAFCALTLANFLDQAGVTCEVLGFTTSAWKGGRSREAWQNSGKPVLPGRLNDLRHIIYKSSEDSFRDSEANFAIMAREGLLKENIDGEALQWAVSRIRKSAKSNKVVIVLSDGAPVDDSTLEENHPLILADHLNEVIADVENAGDVSLKAIGIGHKVSRYYRSSVEIGDVSELGSALVEILREISSEFEQTDYM